MEKNKKYEKKIIIYRINPFLKKKISNKIDIKNNKNISLFKKISVSDIIKNSRKQIKENNIMTILNNFSPFSIEKIIIIT